jgi:hypothetical protein
VISAEGNEGKVLGVKVVFDIEVAGETGSGKFGFFP